MVRCSKTMTRSIGGGWAWRALVPRTSSSMRKLGGAATVSKSTGEAGAVVVRGSKRSARKQMRGATVFVQLAQCDLAWAVDAPACFFAWQQARAGVAGFSAGACRQQHAVAAPGTECMAIALEQDAVRISFAQQHSHWGVAATSVIVAVTHTRQVQAIFRRIRIGSHYPQSRRRV